MQRPAKPFTPVRFRLQPPFNMVKMKKALFLDRDGVINYNHGYVYKIQEFDFIDGIFDLTHAAIEKGYIIIIVTNQAGIGRGYYTEHDFEKLMLWVKNTFISNKSPIHDVYYSPFHPKSGIGKYKKESNLRKPNPGMILKAEKDHNIDLSESIMIGDKISDIQAGVAAGIKKNILFDPSNKDATEKSYIIYINNLKDAISYL